MDNPAVRFRLAASLTGNVIRTLISFATGLIVARALGPEIYGDYTFLLGSFAAIKLILDLGTSNAFFTFLSQRQRGPRFIAAYVAWQLLQFVLTLLIISIALPQNWIHALWIGQPRGLVLLSFIAVFLQQQAWTTLSQVGEAARLTAKVQAINVGVTLFHLLLVLPLAALELISVPLLFALIAGEYLIVIALGWRWLSVQVPEPETFPWRELLREYLKYCKPFFLYCLLGFLCSFADTWLLRNFGGARGMAYYSIASQFSGISLLLVTSLVPVFWKEIAEAHHLGNHARVERLHWKATRLVFVTGALVSGFLMPWSTDILRLLLGAAYEEGALAVAIMFLYPLYVGVGQLGNAMLLATGRTRASVVIGGFFTVISIPVSYAIQAPPDAVLPGFELGAVGMAAKMALLVAINVNVLLWWIAFACGWRFDWAHQVFCLIWTIGSGWLCHAIVAGLGLSLAMPLPLQALLALVFYLAMTAAVVWFFPSVCGLTRAEMNRGLDLAKQLRLR